MMTIVTWILHQTRRPSTSFFPGVLPRRTATTVSFAAGIHASHVANTVIAFKRLSVSLLLENSEHHYASTTNAKPIPTVNRVKSLPTVFIRFGYQAKLSTNPRHSINSIFRAKLTTMDLSWNKFGVSTSVNRMHLLKRTKSCTMAHISRFHPFKTYIPHTPDRTIT